MSTTTHDLTQMSRNGGESLPEKIQKADEAYSKARDEYERVRRSVILDNCSEELRLLLTTLEETKDHCYAERQQLKDLLDGPGEAEAARMD